MLLSVEKMTCNHCVRSVTNALLALDPRARVEVTLSEGTVRVDGAIDVESAARAIRDEGYTVRVLEA
jgi:copper chaperone